MLLNAICKRLYLKQMQKYSYMLENNEHNYCAYFTSLLNSSMAGDALHEEQKRDIGGWL
jgi:hypothetical protein